MNGSGVSSFIFRGRQARSLRTATSAIASSLYLKERRVQAIESITMATKRLQKEYMNLQKAPLDHIAFELVDDDIHQWTATLTGPPSTPYAGGTFELSLVFPTAYPFKPPAIKFVTPVYHPNVKTDTGDMCADLISEGWGPTLNVRHCAQLLRSMLENPEPDHPLEADIAQLLREKPKEFEKKAKAYTKEHAKKSK